jgi:glycosyltransferase involved in cell wall biosynthesis
MQGGVGDFTRELSVALADLGHEVHVITGIDRRPPILRVGPTRLSPPEARPEGSLQAQDKAAGRRIAVHAVVSGWGWRSTGQAAGLAHRLRLDVLDIQYQAAAYGMHPAINFLPWRINFLLARRGGARGGRPKTIVTFHDLKVPYLFPKAGPLRDWVVTLLTRYADAAIVTNRADELALAARRVGRVACIPIGSNIAPALPDDYDRDAWRALLGLTPGDFLLGFFGFFNARKGIETLVQTLASLQQVESLNTGSPIPNTHLLFIGGTIGSSDATNRSYAGCITALIADLGLTENVHYTGFVSGEEVSAAFAATDLCVLPYADGISFHHGTLMAALAHGCPIVSTLPQVELPELKHGGNVWLVPPEDPGTLAASIARLAADPTSRQRLARGAAELAVEFTWERIAARTAEFFEDVVRKA